jgi:acetate kinase
MASNESHILVINSGSSSLKFTVLDPASEEVVAFGIAERLGSDGAGLKLVDLAQKRHEEALPILLSSGARASRPDGRTLFYRRAHLYRRHRRKQPVDPGTGTHASRNPESGDRFKAE